MSGSGVELTHRAMAMLRAVAAGRAQMSCSCEPDLFIDGFACCDQMTAHDLARGGYLRPAAENATGRVTAELTEAGRAALAVSAAA
ncbi:hypothetical protein DMA12_10325 [Amycolatopsis balhimycina DSM 5908]|uniref:MarR family transcriptional regulator n=1 Tax=Amycolatopsis balhimycina DSM 5908 TaxID=1081091 RepID=A0A428WU75_AMYBA|nr:hypothetical protein [Amycolatopsis balhimycina]RSM46633.1 hypothetical protein DMA12_10325 [Amycolatopsis balhimycina DSM 5908]